MKQLTFYCHPLLFLLLVLLSQRPAHGENGTSGSLRAGVAVRVVNPTRPSVTIGHRVMKRFENIYADLCVQAMVIEDKTGQRIVWMGMDFCKLEHEVIDHIKEQIQSTHSIHPHSVCINASHTHSAPPLTAKEVVQPDHFDETYSQRVISQAVAVVGDAIECLEPVRLRYAVDRCQVGINRRSMREGKIQMLPNPNGMVDHRVQIIAAESEKTGKLIGLTVKYACHPVTVVGLGIGSDYPGYMRQIVQQRHPGTTVVFLQGCGADVRIRVVNKDMTGWVKGTLESAEGFGRELADGVERALAKETPAAVIVTGPIKAAYEQVQLPIEKQPKERYLEAASSDNPSVANWGRRFTDLIKQGLPIPETIPYRVQAFQLGNGTQQLTIVALDGEVFTRYGLHLDRLHANGPLITLGYSNGVVAYVPTARALAEGGYEPTAFRYFLVPGPFHNDVEQRVLKAATRVIQRARQ